MQNSACSRAGLSPLAVSFAGALLEVSSFVGYEIWDYKSLTELGPPEQQYADSGVTFLIQLLSELPGAGSWFSLSYQA